MTTPRHGFDTTAITFDAALFAEFNAGTERARTEYLDRTSPMCSNGHRKAVGAVCAPCASAKSKRWRERAK